MATLTEQTLAKPITVRTIGTVPLVAMVTLLTTDHLAHTWDIGHALGLAVPDDPTLVSAAFDWSKDRPHHARAGLFGPELASPDDADERKRLLAYLGRAAWQPVAV